MISYYLTGVGALFLILFLVVRDKNSSIKAIILKTCTSVMFIAVAFTSLYENPWGNIDKVLIPSTLIIAGLIMGLIGDIVLDFKIYLKGISDKYPAAKKDSELVTYMGMGAFGIGHIFFIAGCVQRFVHNNLDLIWSALGAVIFTAIVFVVSIKLLKMRFGKFLVPAASYSVLLCFFTAIAATCIATDGALKSTIFLLIGSILFLLSDLVLSMTYFSKPEDYQKTGPANPESRVMIIVNHVLYYGAQFCIALALRFI